MAERAEIAATADPIIKRGVNLRAAYIWGAGVQISVRDQPDQGQDVNAVVQGFLDDPRNQATFSTVTAKTKLERRLATCGEVFACLPTDPYTGRVRLRVLPQDQIVEIVTDPDEAEFAVAGLSPAPSSWLVRQRLDDESRDGDWEVTARVDLDASASAGAPVIREIALRQR